MHKFIIRGISPHDMNTLLSCDLDNEIIAIDQLAKEGEKLIKISKKEIGAWQVFLRNFNGGQFANKAIHLKDVCTYLNQFNWGAIAWVEEFSEVSCRTTYQDVVAYRKVCILANKALLQGQKLLFNNVAGKEYKIEKKVVFKTYLDGWLRSENRVVQDVCWNPSLQVKHLRKLLQLQHPCCSIRIRDGYGASIPEETRLSLELLKELQLSIRQDLYSPPKPPQQISVQVVKTQPVTVEVYTQKNTEKVTPINIVEIHHHVRSEESPKEKESQTSKEGTKKDNEAEDATKKPFQYYDMGSV